MMALLPLIEAFDHISNFKAWKCDCESFSCCLLMRDHKDYSTDSTHGSLALKAYQQNLYLKYYY